MTFVGLYMYDCAKAELSRGERKVQRIEYKETHLLPLDTSDLKLSSPPTPDLFIQPLSATSATAPPFEEPRRRSGSFSEQMPVQYSPNWHLRSIREMTPPITPRVMSPRPVEAESHENNGQIQGHRRKYSGSTFGVGVIGNGTRKGMGGQEFHAEEIEEKASWE
jgi:hypothetical protein